MTLNAHFALKSVSGSAINELAFLAFGQNCSKIWRATYRPTCQWQNCSPGNLVSSNVRFIWIFAGVCWRGGVKWVWGRRKWRFSLLSLAISSEPSLHIHGRNYYIVLSSPLVTLHWHRNGWPWMTLNGHFALKSGSSTSTRHPMGWRFWLSEKTVRKFAELYADSGAKNAAPTVLAI